MKYKMRYVNPPEKLPANMRHCTFYSRLYGRELGYCIYLPEDYGETDFRYPVVYHLHGWTGSEISEIWTMEPVCRARRAITVFANNSGEIEDDDGLPVEDMLLTELIPHIDETYLTDARRESRAISGFSMGGGMAFMYAVRHAEVFTKTIPYAGTYHHYFNREYETVGTPAQNAPEIYAAMVEEKKFGENNVIKLLYERADVIRGRLEISIHVGTDDVLFCDNEILRLHLEALKIPFEYITVPGAGHELHRIL